MRYKTALLHPNAAGIFAAPKGWHIHSLIREVEVAGKLLIKVLLEEQGADI